MGYRINGFAQVFKSLEKAAAAAARRRDRYGAAWTIYHEDGAVELQALAARSKVLAEAERRRLELERSAAAVLEAEERAAREVAAEQAAAQAALVAAIKEDLAVPVEPRPAADPPAPQSVNLERRLAAVLGTFAAVSPPRR